MIGRSLAANPADFRWSRIAFPIGVSLVMFGSPLRTSPFTGYYDRGCRKEGFDLENL